MSKSSAKLMTEGSIWKRIVAFAIPLFWGNLFQQLYNTADSLIVGNFLGSSALAAVSSSGNLIFLMVGLFNGIAIGSGVIVAKYYGARDIPNLQKSIHTTVGFGLICGVILTIVGIIAAPQILVLMGTPEAVLPNSITYFRIYFTGSLAFVMYNFFVGILQSVGDSTHPLIYLIVSSVTNIILDLVLIAGLGFGVGAAAFATVISQFLSAILCMVQLLQSGGVSASSEPDQSGFLYAPPDHFLWSARRTPELDHFSGKCIRPGKYQPVWGNGGCRMWLLYEDPGIWIPSDHLFCTGTYYFYQSESGSKRI